MKIKYINEGAFGSYKNKSTSEDKLKNLKKETVKVLINDVVKQLPDLLQERIGSKEYLDSVFSKRSVESYNYNFSKLFLRIQDFLGVEVESNTIYLQFASNFIAASGYTTSGPIGYVLDVYDLNYYNTYLMAEALCKDLEDEIGPGIKFDFRFIVSDDLKNSTCDRISVINRNKINSWSLENLQRVIKYPEFLIKHKYVYDNRTADEVYLKILEKTYNSDNTQLNLISGMPSLSIENLSDSIKFENKAVQTLLELCQFYPNKIHFYINPNKDLDNVIECCEALTGKSLEFLLNHSIISMLNLKSDTLSSKAFIPIVQELSHISNDHFYVSTLLKSDNKRILTPCDSKGAMDLLIDKTYGKVISGIELGLFKGMKKNYMSRFKDVVKLTKPIEDINFYYLHVIIKDI